MNLVSLYTGIGVFDLAAVALGWHIVAQVEIDPFCLGFLNYWYPGVRKYSSDEIFLNEYDGTECIDIVCGGDPCQPSSLQGNRQGVRDPRYRWPYMLQIIDRLQPAWVVNENVLGQISDGSTERKTAELSDRGYEVQPIVVPAGLTALHLRRRVFLVANRPEGSMQPCKAPTKPNKEEEGIQSRLRQLAFAEWPEAGAVSLDTVLHRADGTSEPVRPGIRGKSVGALGNAIHYPTAFRILSSIHKTVYA